MDKTQIKEELHATLEAVDEQMAAVVDDLERQHKSHHNPDTYPWNDSLAYTWRDINGRPVLLDLLVARSNLIVALSNVEWKN